jgi:hypothetical protein
MAVGQTPTMIDSLFSPYTLVDLHSDHNGQYNKIHTGTTKGPLTWTNIQNQRAHHDRRADRI